ncbi:hypothetical protein CGK12_24895, partial [Vibrio parahaemolyticus]
MEMINTGASLDFLFVRKIFEEFYPKYEEFDSKYLSPVRREELSKEDLLFISSFLSSKRLIQLGYSVKY